MKGMRLGDRVKCSAYIKHSKNHYEIISSRQDQFGVPGCCMRDGCSEESEAVEDFHNCERYRTIEKDFTGVYVGTTVLCTRLNAEYYEDNYGNTGYRTYCDNPQKFALVYYADNKKRLVPIDRLKGEI